MIEKRSRLNLFAYYFSFVLIYLVLTYLVVLIIADYEDGSYTAKSILHRMAFALFSFLRFPFGLLITLLTGEESYALFTVFINPLLLGWVLLKTLSGKYENFGESTLRINYLMAALIVSVYIVFTLFTQIKAV